MKLNRNRDYYTGIVYEFNIPTGHSCPFALECKVKVDRETGKFDVYDGQYKCYASNAERFPAVRQHRWNNWEHVLAGLPIEFPKRCKSVRIHASGDFFNQAYFDMWLETCRQHPEIEFWAFTKSVGYWVKRINEIPPNLALTASYGGRQDKLIDEHNLRHCAVYSVIGEVPEGMPIDDNDDYARISGINFALLDNGNRSNRTVDIDAYNDALELDERVRGRLLEIKGLEV